MNPSKTIGSTWQQWYKLLSFVKLKGWWKLPALTTCNTSKSKIATWDEYSLCFFRQFKKQNEKKTGYLHHRCLKQKQKMDQNNRKLVVFQTDISTTHFDMENGAILFTLKQHKMNSNAFQNHRTTNGSSFYAFVRGCVSALGSVVKQTTYRHTNTQSTSYKPAYV